MRSTPPLYEMAINPAKFWPDNVSGLKTHVQIVRKGSGKLVALIPISLTTKNGRLEAIRVARHFIKMHNTALAKHRKNLAEGREVERKLNKETP